MADAGEVMLGAVGREVFGAAQIMFLVFVMGSHILTFAIMLNTVSNHGTCSIVFGVVGLLVSLVCTMPRTLHKVSYMSIASFISIVAAVLITMIGVGVERPGDGKVDVRVQSNLYMGFKAVTNIIFAYAGEHLVFSFSYLLLAPLLRHWVPIFLFFSGLDDYYQRRSSKISSFASFSSTFSSSLISSYGSHKIDHVSIHYVFHFCPVCAFKRTYKHIR